MRKNTDYVMCLFSDILMFFNNDTGEFTTDIHNATVFTEGDIIPSVNNASLISLEKAREMIKDQMSGLD